MCTVLRLSAHFPYQEFFHPDYIKYFKAIGWTEHRIFDHLKRWVNPAFIDNYESQRRRYGSLWLNDWHLGGDIRNAGKRLRPFIFNGVEYGEREGAPMSSHYESNSTGDFHYESVTPEEVQADVLHNQDDFPHLYRIEDAKLTKTWFHQEIGERSRNGIIIFKPGNK